VHHALQQSLSLLDPSNPAHAEEIAIIQSLMAGLPQPAAPLALAGAAAETVTKAAPSEQSGGGSMSAAAPESQSASMCCNCD
jgi:hypothetical protein